MRFYWFFMVIFILLGQVLVLNARMMVKDRSQFYTEEHVDGQLFAHRLDYFEGVRKEQWNVDGKFVDAKTYQERILEAEKNERRRERHKEEQEKVDQQLFKMKAQRAILKKLVQAQLQFFMHDTALLEQHHLEPYFVYAQGTFANSEAYTNFVAKTLVNAQKILQEQSDGADNSELQEAHEQLEAMHDKWKLFVRSALEQAIEKCNDTKMLKELLQLVA